MEILFFLFTIGKASSKIGRIHLNHYDRLVRKKVSMNLKLISKQP